MPEKEKRPARVVIPVRLAPAAIEEVDQIAEQETEGNRSLMIRKLLSEAMTARRKK